MEYVLPYVNTALSRRITHLDINLYVKELWYSNKYSLYKLFYVLNGTVCFHRSLFISFNDCENFIFNLRKFLLFHEELFWSGKWTLLPVYGWYFYEFTLTNKLYTIYTYFCTHRDGSYGTERVINWLHHPSIPLLLTWINFYPSMDR